MTVPYQLSRKGALFFIALLTTLSIISSSFYFHTSFAEASNHDTLLLCSDILPAGAISTTALQPDGLMVESGESASVAFSVNNTFPHTVSGVNVYAAVTYPGEVLPSEWFVVVEDLTIASGGESSQTLTWNIPQSSRIGAYTATLFAGPISETAFLAQMISPNGLQTEYNFIVGGEAEVPEVYIDTSTFTLNGLEAAPQALNLVPADFTEVAVGFDILNTFTNQPMVGTLTWNVYEGLEMNPSRLIDTVEEEVRLLSDTVRTSVYEASFGLKEQLLVVATLERGDGQSSNFIMPLQRDNPSEGVLPPLPYVTQIAAVDENTLVGCITTVGADSSGLAQSPKNAAVTAMVALYPKTLTGARADNPSVTRTFETDTFALAGGQLGFSIDTAGLGKTFDVEVVLMQDEVEVERIMRTVSCSDCGEKGGYGGGTMLWYLLFLGLIGLLISIFFVAFARNTILAIIGRGNGVNS